MQGRIALVTGSTSGIGKGIAEALAKAGYHIVLNGFGEPAEIESLRESFTQLYGVKVLYSAANLSDPAQIEAMISMIESTLGPISILVNNAGIQHVDAIENFPPARWDAILAINLTSAFHTIRLTLPHMYQQQWGRIINIASTHGLVASARKSAYVAAKHGLVGLSKVIALEAAGSGVTCNAVCPGWVYTPLVEKQVIALAEQTALPFEEAKRALLAEKQPSLEFTTVEQIGGLVTFLCSDLAKNMTGSILTLDGGWTAQ